MSIIRNLIYHARYALTLYRGVPDMSVFHAIKYPRPDIQDRDDPVEDAHEEIYCMREG